MRMLEAQAPASCSATAAPSLGLRHFWPSFEGVEGGVWTAPGLFLLRPHGLSLDSCPLGPVFSFRLSSSEPTCPFLASLKSLFTEPGWPYARNLCEGLAFASDGAQRPPFSVGTSQTCSVFSEPPDSRPPGVGQTAGTRAAARCGADSRDPSRRARCGTRVSTFERPQADSPPPICRMITLSPCTPCHQALSPQMVGAGGLGAGRQGGSWQLHEARRTKGRGPHPLVTWVPGDRWCMRTAAWLA